MKIALNKFGSILNSRPAGREAALVIKAYSRPAEGEKLELDFTGVLSVGPSWLDEVLTALRDELGVDRVVCLPSDNASVKASLEILDAH
jgi:hypothetical protein